MIQLSALRNGYSTLRNGYRSARDALRPLKVTLPLAAVSVVAAWLIARSGGDLAALSLGFLPLSIALAVLLLAAKVRPLVITYLALGVALAVDERLTPWARLYRGISELSGQQLDWFIYSPLELLLFAALLGQTLRAMRARQLPFRAGPFLWAMAPFFVFVLLGLLFGLLRGGDANIALWELRAIPYMPITYLLVYNSLTGREQINRIGWIVLLATGFLSFLGSWLYFVILKGDLGDLEMITGHEEAIFFNLLFLWAVAHWFYRGDRNQRRVLLLLLPLTLVSYVATDRRVGYLALAVGIAMMMLLSYRDARAKVVLTAVSIGLFSLLYAGAFWNNDGVLGKPVKAFKSVAAQPGEKDWYSNLYRYQEKWNISYNVRKRPIQGVGFGKPFEMPVQMADWDSPFRSYITHNSVVWIWMKTGLGGFIAFMSFLGIAVFRTARTFRRVADPEMKPFLATALLFLPMYMIYSYLDQGWDYKGMLFMGAVLGIFGALERIAPGPEKADG